MSLCNKLIISFALIAFSPLYANSWGIEQVAETGEWKNFTSKENGFSVDLPKTPDHVQQKIDVPKTHLSIKYDTYISEPTDNMVYVISVWYYPSEIDMSKPEVNLKDGFEGMITALPGSKVETMEMTNVNGFKALEFKVKHEDLFFQGKLILVHNTLYQVFTVYKASEDAKDNYKKFMNSFQLIDTDQNQVPTKTGSKKMNVMLESF